LHGSSVIDTASREEMVISKRTLFDTKILFRGGKICPRGRSQELRPALKSQAASPAQITSLCGNPPTLSKPYDGVIIATPVNQGLRRERFAL
jgi:hypothetical protein